MTAGFCHRVADRSLGVRARHHRPAEGSEDLRVALIASARLEVLEALRQLVGVIEDALDGSRHDHQELESPRATGVVACASG